MTVSKDYTNAVGRWSALGPYYAMFPLEFADSIISTFSAPGAAVLDPFAGRASSIYSAVTQDRSALGIEINPVGWLYGRVKLNPGEKQSLLRKLRRLANIAREVPYDALRNLPKFFTQCYSPDVRRFLIVAREQLRWKTEPVDATMMAFILVYLHGKVGQALSNQMRQGKAMSPDYSVRWWIERDMVAPQVDVYEFFKQRIEWRYAKGTQAFAEGEMILGDSSLVLPKLARAVQSGKRNSFDLLFTSPPYFEVTNYHYDQWLRLWMLGGPPTPRPQEGNCRGKFASTSLYTKLLSDVFTASAECMHACATVYVRTDARDFTLEATIEALCSAFPRKRLKLIKQPVKTHTQTALFGDKSKKPGEVDILLT